MRRFHLVALIPTRQYVLTSSIQISVQIQYTLYINYRIITSIISFVVHLKCEEIKTTYWEWYHKYKLRSNSLTQRPLNVAACFIFFGRLFGRLSQNSELLAVLYLHCPPEGEHSEFSDWKFLFLFWRKKRVPGIACKQNQFHAALTLRIPF